MNGKLHEPGDLIGEEDRYEITNYISEGGMQEVYLARDHCLQRNVALKAPKNYSAKKRFKRSAVLSAKVNHPHVAKTLDYFDFHDRSYLIEEFVEGRDFRKVLTREFLIVDPYLAGHLLHHLSKGIAASHHVEVVHRDLKPSNIMILGGYDLSEVKITDFGIAKMAEEELAEAAAGGDSTITSSQTMLGALPYMAPEMIENPRNAGKPADVWALGAIIYEVLSGEKPFGVGLTAVPKILSGNLPPKPRYIDAKVQFRSLGDELFDIIINCFHLDPQHRLSSDDIVKKCENLCYQSINRSVGNVNNIKYNSWGFIEETSGSEVFFHLDSVYGPSPKKGSKVCFSVFPGNPSPRAHPVILLRNH